MVALFTACTGGARRVETGDPVVLKIGTFLTQETVGRLSALLSTDPLVAVGWDGHPVFRLASSATESPDGQVHTLKLRSGVRFHNGEPVTAPIVRDILAQKIEVERRRRTEMTGIQDIAAEGADTLIIRVAKGASFELSDLNIYTVSDDGRPQVRTGPFKIAPDGSATVLERFDGYYQGTPSPSRIEIAAYGNHRLAWTAMMRGDVNFLHEVNREAIEFTEAGGNIRAYRLLRPYYVPLVFNMKHPILSRREVRVALNQAVDREEIVRNGMRGGGRAAQAPFWPHHWAYSEGALPPTFSPDSAKLRLDAAGLRMRPTERTGVPSRFSFTCLMPNDPRFERIALVLQRQLFTVGVDMQVLAVPPREFATRVQAGNYDTFLYEMTSGRTLSWVYRFWHSPVEGLATPMWNGYVAADAALERMRAARRDDEVRIAVADVAKVMRDDPPALFLVWPYEARAVEKSIQVPYEPDRDIFGTFWQARRFTTDEAGQ